MSDEIKKLRTALSVLHGCYVMLPGADSGISEYVQKVLNTTEDATLPPGKEALSERARIGTRLTEVAMSFRNSASGYKIARWFDTAEKFEFAACKLLDEAILLARGLPEDMPDPVRVFRDRVVSQLHEDADAEQARAALYPKGHTARERHLASAETLRRGANRLSSEELSRKTL